jgi:hypothetical protein
MDKAHDGHGVANQLAKLEQKARERGWTVVYRLSEPWRGRDRSHYFEHDDPGGLGRVPPPVMPDL